MASQIKMMLVASVLAGMVSLVVTSTTFSRNGASLTTFPPGIPLDTEVIKLDDNDICQIDDIPFFGSVYSVSLERNCLDVFPNLCSLNHTLLHIMVKDNEMTTIPSSRLSCVQRLEYLDLSNNQLTAIPFVVLTNLETVKLYVNQFTRLPPFKHITPNVIRVQASDNSLHGSEIPKEILDIGANLELVTLAGLGLNNLNLDTISKLSKLHNIKLSRNEISIFPQIGPSTKTLETIDLSDNPITSIDPGEIRKFTQLVELSLKNCHIRSIPMLCQMGLNLAIKLEGNPLVCDCNTKELKLAVEANLVTVSNKPCAKPTELSSTALADIAIDQFICKDDGKEQRCFIFNHV